MLVTTSQGELHCLDAKTGTALWAVMIGLGPISTPPAVHCDGLHHGTLACECDAANAMGKFRKDMFLPWHAVAVASNKGYVSVIQSSIHGLHDEPNIPSLCASVMMPAEIFSSPVFFSGSIYLGCRDDKLYKVQ